MMAASITFKLEVPAFFNKMAMLQFTSNIILTMSLLTAFLCLFPVLALPWWTISAALLSIGLVLPLLAFHQVCPDKKWHYHAQTLVRMLVVLILLPHSNPMVLLFFCLCLTMIPLVLIMLVKEKIMFLCTMAILWIASLIALRWIDLDYMGTFMQLTMGMHILLYREELWTCTSRKLSKGQHKEIWPQMSNNSALLWNKMFEMSQYNGGAAQALATLNLQTLLGFFESTLYREGANANAHAMDDLERHVKLAINALEPRAIVVWELYPTEQAAKYIANIDAHETSGPYSNVLELPAL